MVFERQVFSDFAITDCSLFNSLSRLFISTKIIFSSRPDLKLLNTNIQNYLVNVMEPIFTVCLTLGFEYSVETVREIWKLLFENAAHDSIGSCVSDTTNEDV